MSNPITPNLRGHDLSFDAMYAAITGRDVRFDGAFYTAVRTTGVYCRPSCPARKPHRDNVTFYLSAAAAQSAGYRACRRCVPEALPGSLLWDVPGSVCARALQLIERGVVDDEGVEGLASRLGWSSRTVTRTLVELTGATPIAHARARRARLAHALITGTAEPFAAIAFAAGFASIRQFNDTVRNVYGANPSQLRSTPRTDRVAGALRASLTYRPPLDWKGLLSWYRIRALPSVEVVSGGSYQIALALPHGPAIIELTNNSARHRIDATLDLNDLRDYGPACTALRRILDLDADPVGIDDHLQSIPHLGHFVRTTPGIRIPGTPTPLQALLSALVGQHVSDAAELTQLHRLTDAADDATSLCPFPTATDILGAGLAWFRGPAAQRDTITAALEIATTSVLDPANDPDEVAAALRKIKGIGTRTIEYTLMCGYGLPDVDLSGDPALIRAVQTLPDQSAHRCDFLTATSPWGSYAALYLWRHASALLSAHPNLSRSNT